MASPSTTSIRDEPMQEETGRKPPRRRRKLLWLTASIVGVLALLAGAGIWWFLRDDAPAEVDLAEAVSSLEATAADSDSASEPATNPTSPSSPEEVEGVWVVDTSIGEFSYEDSTGTFVGFRVEEELSNIGSTTAVGRTPDVSGSIEIEGTVLTAATIEADMTSITTNESRRDGAVQDALDTGEFPSATFELTEPVELGDDPGAGNALTFTAIGELTIHGVAVVVELPLEAQLTDNTHGIRRCNDDIEVHCPAFNGLCEIFEADNVSAGRGSLIGILTLRENGNPDCLARAIR